MSKVLLFGAIASVLAINLVFADPVTVTTQDYVDTAVATKQDKITAKTDEYYPDSVITDTETNGTVSKRLVVYGDPYNAWFVDDTAIGAALFQGALLSTLPRYVDGIYNYSDAELKNAVVSAGVLDKAFKSTHLFISTKQKTKVCVQYIDGAAETSENCLLWNLPD
ncbi:MAG: hypothetical protein IJQ90_00855 [Alphaproteobacteria bacterium]|nr:hypothetical protein [Alphaproteobacteria bacterium]